MAGRFLWNRESCLPFGFCARAEQRDLRCVYTIRVSQHSEDDGWCYVCFVNAKLIEVGWNVCVWRPHEWQILFVAAIRYCRDIITTALRLISVSYTHLDVYKRQVAMCVCVSYIYYFVEFPAGLLYNIFK